MSKENKSLAWQLNQYSPEELVNRELSKVLGERPTWPLIMMCKWFRDHPANRCSLKRGNLWTIHSDEIVSKNIRNILKSYSVFRHFFYKMRGGQWLIIRPSSPQKGEPWGTYR